MRARVIILVIALAAVGGFAALNWSEFTRTTPLNFGLVIEEASLPLILLGALGLALLWFLIASARSEHHRLVEYRQHGQALQAQRELADKAEASRFTELRQHIDAQLRESRQHEGLAIAEFEKSVAAHQREVRAQLEQINRTLATRLGSVDGNRHDGGHHDLPRAELGGDPLSGRHNRDVSGGRMGARDDVRDVRPGDGSDADRPGTRTTIL